MGEQAKTSSNRNMHAIILGVLGIIFLVLGVTYSNNKGHRSARFRLRHTLNCSWCCAVRHFFFKIFL